MDMLNIVNERGRYRLKFKQRQTLVRRYGFSFSFLPC